MIARRRISIVPTSPRVSSGRDEPGAITTREGWNASLSRVDLHLYSNWAAKYGGEMVFEPQEGRLDPAIRREREDYCHDERECLGDQELPAPDRMKQVFHHENCRQVQQV